MTTEHDAECEYSLDNDRPELGDVQHQQYMAEARALLPKWDLLDLVFVLRWTVERGDAGDWETPATPDIYMIGTIEPVRIFTAHDQSIELKSGTELHGLFRRWMLAECFAGGAEFWVDYFVNWGW